MSSTDRVTNRSPLGFWIIGLALVVYVAACTVQRDNTYGIDAWEHERAVLALTRHLWKPGNPTYALNVPSVRYSPYTIVLAIVCRTIGIGPYTALSGAAVVNMALLVIGVWLLLNSFGEAESATAVLVVMVCLWGGVPGWANSYALADLPWHEVDPAAFAFPVVLIAWSLFRGIVTGKPAAVRWIGIGILMTTAVLDHGMTGAFGLCGIAVIAVTGPHDRRAATLLGTTALAACVGLLCLVWPWYSFWEAVRWHGGQGYWFESRILLDELLVWSAPAVICALFALPMRHKPLVRMCLAGGAMSLGAGAAAILTRSPVLARFPIPGLIFFHLMVGLFAHESAILRPAAWGPRIRRLLTPMQDSTPAILQTALSVVLVYFLVPQLYTIGRRPYLARPYLARIFHLTDKQLRVRHDFARLLSPVGENDVVLADEQTSWLVPTTAGKIVAAIHFELFVSNQLQRGLDVQRFFASDDEQQREDCIRRYHVRWILLNPLYVPEPRFEELLRSAAVVRRVDGFVLMDANRWIAAAPSRNPTRFVVNKTTAGQVVRP